VSQATTARSLIPLEKAEHPETATDVLAALHPIAPAVGLRRLVVCGRTNQAPRPVSLRSCRAHHQRLPPNESLTCVRFLPPTCVQVSKRRGVVTLVVWDFGEGGIRTRHDPLDSVSCRFQIAANAVNASDAVAPCTRLHPRLPDVRLERTGDLCAGRCLDCTQGASLKKHLTRLSCYYVCASSDCSQVRHEAIVRRFRHHARNARAPRCNNTHWFEPPTTPMRISNCPPAGASIGENLICLSPAVRVKSGGF
jgi:hypothetical protein